MKLWRNLKPIFTDDRGDIFILLDDGSTNIKSTLLITCKKGAIRANHYHKEDSHYTYMLSGKMEYTEQPVEANVSKRETATLAPGDMVYSAPMMMHAMRFLEDSTFIALATKSRKDGAYEQDTVRVKLI